MEKVKIVIAEDHIRYRKTMISLLNQDPRFTVVGETAQGEEVVELATRLKPNVVLMDIKLEGKNGIDATREIKHVAPNIKVIGISLYPQQDHQENMLAFGASAYLDKSCSIEQIMSTIVEVNNDNYIMDIHS
jgi:DNA-binding NarL/FixJ family response regulator